MTRISTRNAANSTRGDTLLVRIRAVPARIASNRVYRASYVADFTSLRDGREGNGRRRGFSGRPELAREVVAGIAPKLSVNRPSKDQFDTLLASIAHLWVFLDKCEAASPSLARISHAADLRGDVWREFMFYLEQLGADRAHDVYQACTQALKATGRLENNSFEMPPQPFVKPTIAQRRLEQDPYSPAVMEQIAEACRKERAHVRRRIAAANVLADNGDPFHLTLARYYNAREKFDAIWTLENRLSFVRDALLTTLPNTETVRELHGIWPSQIGVAPDVPRRQDVVGTRQRSGASLGGAGLIGLYRHFLPTFHDLVALAVEAMTVAGWNPEVVLSINRHNWYTTAPDEYSFVVYSRKSRAKGSVISWYSGAEQNSLHEIISHAIAITEPLHRFVVSELEALGAMPPTAAAAARIGRLTELKDRVWLCLIPKGGRVSCLESNNEFLYAANEIIQRHGILEYGKPARWSSRRLRDGAAASKFDEASDLKAVQNLLVHASKDLSNTYLDTPSRTRAEDKKLRNRTEGLMAGVGWPVAGRPHVDVGSPADLIVTPLGAAWLELRGISVADDIAKHGKQSSKK